METEILEPVRESVLVGLEPGEAFELFTARLGSWWPAGHRIGARPFAEAMIEPRVGGRWYERDAEGAECDWGRVLAWDRPRRLVLSWDFTSRFEPEPDPARTSEVEVRFTPHRDGTLVELEHRGLERHRGGGDPMRAAVSRPGGWPGVLAAFASAAR